MNEGVETEKKLHYANLLNQPDNKNKKMWELVRLKLNKKNECTVIKLKVNDKIITDPFEIANLFGNHFANFVKNKSHLLFSYKVSCTLPKRCNNTFQFNLISMEETKNIIRSLKNKTSVGADEIPTKLVKESCDLLAPYITTIINLSVAEGCFPKSLKLSKTTPVFKKGDKELIENYRPIVTNSPIAKVIEKAISIRLQEFFDREKIIPKEQHGFQRGLSTETATTELVQHLYDRIDQKETVIGIFFDLSQAFDTLNPKFLTAKLDCLGIRGSTNKFIESYVSGRNLKTKIGETYSNPFNVELGTPQGGVLGPLLFKVYIADLPHHIKEGKIFQYCDDTTILISGKSSEEINAKINIVLKNFQEYCSKNHLILNPKKTVIVEFTGQYIAPLINISAKIDGEDISKNSHTKFLGSELDTQLKWSIQIDCVLHKLNSAFFAILTLKSSLDRHSLLNVYYSTVYSVISYNILSWGRATECERIFVQQKRILRLIFEVNPRHSCRETFKRNKILTLTGIYLYKLLQYMHKNKDTFQRRCDIHSYPTRNNENLLINKYNHFFHKKSPIHSGKIYYNMLPAEFKAVGEQQFKKLLRQLLTNNVFYTLLEFENHLKRC